jgi:MoxR-like ATPase
MEAVQSTKRLPPSVADAVVGRRRELALLLTAVRLRKPVLLVGPPGVSKTTMLRVLAEHLGNDAERFIWVTGDEQLTAHTLVGTFDPALVLKDGYRPDHFRPGPLARAMQAGAILYVEEINRAPSGALNALLTALSEGYLEVPRLGRLEARSGFMLAGGANPLDDVGTTRLARGLLDRFVIVELDYQSREDEIEIVRRNTGGRLPRLREFAVDLGRASRTHPELRHGASIRAAIDFVLLAAEQLEAGTALDRTDLEWLACAAYAGKVRVRPPAAKSACEIIVELFDKTLVNSYGGGVEFLLGHSSAGMPAEGDGPLDGAVAEEGEAGVAEGGQRKHAEGRDEVPGRAQPGGGGEPGRSRSVPMTGRDRAPAGGELSGPPARVASAPLADFRDVIGRARDLVLRVRGAPLPTAPWGGGSALQSREWQPGADGELDVVRTLEQYVARGTDFRAEDVHLHTRVAETCNYLVLIDHSGSMVGRKLNLAAVMAAVLAKLSTAGRARYAVIAFDEELSVLKNLDLEEDVEAVIERILRLPEGRSTDLSRALGAAAEFAEQHHQPTEVILISDCMPTRGSTSFSALQSAARAVPSLHVCYVDEQLPAIRFFDESGTLDLYEWWARRWVGDERVYKMRDEDDTNLVIDGLSASRETGL